MNSRSAARSKINLLRKGCWEEKKEKFAVPCQVSATKTRRRRQGRHYSAALLLRAADCVGRFSLGRPHFWLFVVKKRAFFIGTAEGTVEGLELQGALDRRAARFFSLLHFQCTIFHTFCLSPFSAVPAQTAAEQRGGEEQEHWWSAQDPSLLSCWAAGERDRKLHLKMETNKNYEKLQNSTFCHKNN